MSKNLKKKALFPVIAMVLVSVVALSGATYAWFTTSNSASINELSVQVTAADGIQISTDAKTWKSTLATSDILTAAYEGNVNQVPNGSMYPVSTGGTLSAKGLLQMYKGELQADNTLTSTKETDTAGNTGNYIAFDLFFKMATAKKISLVVGDNASKVYDGTGAADTNASYSARVAFIDMGASQTASGAIALGSASDTLTIWEPNATSHLDSLNATGKLGYKGVNNEGNSGTATIFTTDGVITINPDATAQILSLEAGINKVRIYIWMEGQDVDCINDASGGTFITNLKFEQPAENN